MKPLSLSFAPAGPKVRNVHVLRQFLDQFVQLPSEMDFATGHSPGASKAAPEVPKVAKSDESSFNFALFNQKLMPVSSEIGKSYQSI